MRFPSAEAIQASLRAQLELAPLVVFDVPLGTDKNRRLFERDTEEHPAESMTDDLVVALSRSR